MNTYSVTDIQLASVLVYLGFEITATDKTDPNRVRFIFLNHDDLSSAIEGYFSGVLRVEPARIFQCMKALKSRIYTSIPDNE